jgi:flagellar hook-basal body complex protein FliE
MDVNPIVPDLPSYPSTSEAPTVTPLPPSSGTPAPGSATSEVPSFKDSVMNLLQDVNTKLQDSDQNMRDLAMGKSNDLEHTVESVEEANLALSYTIAIRSKLLDAYNEIARITV